MKAVEISRGDSPIVLGLPHTGTDVADEIAACLSPRGAELADTDWHVHTLYDGLLPGATLVRATFHRYVIDANRDPTGASLYPGQHTTGLVPETDFDGQPIWLQAPSSDEIERRRETYHAVYHSALTAELQRVRDIHGVAILYDCHSIRSKIPYLFDGTLPDFNIGTNGGAACARRIESATAEICARAEGYSHVTNGRFKGGWATRRYGRPDNGIHAIQMELAQSTYLAAENAPWQIDADKTARLRLHLKDILTTLAKLAPSLAAFGETP